MQQLKKGDRVKIPLRAKERWMNQLPDEGVVVSNNVFNEVSVYFEGWYRGHNCHGLLRGEKSASGWNFHTSELEKLQLVDKEFEELLE